MTSVLYDAPGPVARRRELVGSVLGTLILLAVVGVGVWYAAQRGVFDADRWDVLYDPPKNQTAADVWTFMLRGLRNTLWAAVVAAPVALAAGLALAVWRTIRFPLLRLPAVLTIELLRGLPVLLMMFFGLLALGLTSFQAVVFGLVLYNTAIFAEILRAGLAALPKGQTEAAYAIGLSRSQTLLTILLPQAVRNMLPSLVAQLVVLLKDSSLGFIVGYPELLKSVQNNAQFFGNRYYVALFLAGATIYLIVNFTLSWVARRVGRRSNRRSTSAPLDETALAAANTPGTGPGTGGAGSAR